MVSATSSFLSLAALNALAVPSSGLQLQLGPLLSTAVHACQRGCTEIRNVQTVRENNDGNLAKIELKDVSDPRSALTEADEAAHRAILGSLVAEWGDELRIVGEEDDDDESMKLLNDMIFEPLDRDRFVDDIGETADIDSSRVTIFVDPLDGTREFVEGRLENCQVLVGIAIDGEAAAGVIGMPFPDGTLQTEPTIVYGLDGMGTGVVGSFLTRGPYPLERNIDGVKYPRPHHATGDSTTEVMEACRRGAIEGIGGSNVIYGGAGNKILAAALGEVGCSIQHAVGGAWDLCAPEAILKAMGGTMTDLFGEEIEIYRDDAPSNCNKRGYLATPSGMDAAYHKRLAGWMLAQPEVQKYRQEIQNM
mmetsp:Transcript_2482/g.6177  ORF Transcript_2482/g.6177 Transcript_2482/m.6177 type:complete len:363 (-) Transcript_2482:129-1217(-)|eukprot:CAMPEP_0181104674 /NCGR_PEP_ID=MMETSP1071-20121207/15559_1 /TAXON_ID=35127 /ORGANISM="Thalassiosira sp., Strain NH16" /LENGTH=362 /DNA_ID=CAMNT_0023187899 /DNA_START=86 /DNA_END=1174 /DNA_ORIENTATION=+